MSTTRIWKYPLKITDFQVIPLRKTTRILSVQEQRGELCLWAMVDTLDKEVVAAQVYIVGTGNPVPVEVERAVHLGSVQMAGGFVWHVFVER